jgi:hypothetical protein
VVSIRPTNTGYSTTRVRPTTTRRHDVEPHQVDKPSEAEIENLNNVISEKGHEEEDFDFKQHR